MHPNITLTALFVSVSYQSPPSSNSITWQESAAVAKKTRHAKDHNSIMI